MKFTYRPTAAGRAATARAAAGRAAAGRAAALIVSLVLLLLGGMGNPAPPAFAAHNEEADVTLATPAESEKVPEPAETGPIRVAARNRLGVGAQFRLPGVPLLSAGLHMGDVSFSIEGIGGVHDVLDLQAASRIMFGMVRYRAPLAWHDWFPFIDGGIVSVRSDVEGVTLSAPGAALGIGVERAVGGGEGRQNPLALRADVRVLRLLQETHWLAGIGLEWRFDLPRTTGGGRRDNGAAPGGTRGGTQRGPAPDTPGQITAVEAAGTITGTSLPLSVRGEWSLAADAHTEAADFSASGTVDGDFGSIGFSNPSRLRFHDDSVEATFVEFDQHEGLDVTATVTVTVSRTDMSLHVSARRADGLSASATLYGSTAQFTVPTVRSE